MCLILFDERRRTPAKWRLATRDEDVPARMGEAMAHDVAVIASRAMTHQAGGVRPGGLEKTSV